MEYLDLVLFIDDFEHVFMNLTENIGMTQVFFRILMIRIWNSELGEIIKEAKNDFNAEKYTDEEIEKFVSFYAKSKFLLKLLLSNTVFTALMYFLSPLLIQKTASKYL